MYDMFRHRMQIQGADEGQNRRERSMNYMARRFKDDPSYRQLEIIRPTGEVEMRDFRLINESFVKQLNPERTYAKYAILHPFQDIEGGCIVRNVDGYDWLVSSRASYNGVATQVMLLKLGQVIKWQPKGSTEIHSIKVFVRAVSEVADGVLKTQMFVLPDELIEIKLQENKDTMQINTGDKVIIRGKVYRLWKKDIYTDENIIQFIAQQEQEGPYDNVEEGVADMKEPKPIEDFSISGEDYIYYSDENDYTVINDKGENQMVEWTVMDSRHAVDITEDTPGRLVIRATNKKGLNGAVITIRAVLDCDRMITKTVEFGFDF